MIQDVIAALSTPPGEGGIAIIRLSGPGVINQVARIFKPHSPGVDIKERPGYSLTLGHIVDDRGLKIDEVLIGIMRGPKSYTGEDVVEINCHGGILPARRCLKRVLDCNVRLAEPGEFTKRAFLNGRMDASQAEAVIDIIRAKTEKGLKVALNQLEGTIGKEIGLIEDELIGINAAIEASVDFPDEVEEPDYEELKVRIANQIDHMKKLLSSSQRGEIYRDGIKAAIIGKPNVGKSSLLNALVKQEKAIVTELPGTTRDVIEDYINIRGIPVKIMDTAGIRDTKDPVESIGVQRSRQAIEGADLIIMVLDVGSGLAREDLEIFKSIEEHKIIILVNKDDLAERMIKADDIEKHFYQRTVIWVSVKEGQGLELLENTIEEMVFSGLLEGEDYEVAFNLRQKRSMEKGVKSLEDGLNNMGTLPLDCLAVDIGGTLESLGEISGKSLKEDVINRIFHDFCIGK
ncbi:MAG: tRNA uridine-5-carboxymethylaminomethyl(34) synthesis GTPase MnmE [Syntrophomonadaceae bacterium]